MSSAFAQSGTGSDTAPGTWVSSMNIQNVGTEDANVSILFYDSTGTLVTTFDVTPAIPAGGSRSLYLPTDVSGLGSGQFSAIASSNIPIKVVVNLSSTTPYTAGAYEGFDSAQVATKIFFPGLYNNYYGFNSEIVLQNTDASAANVSIQFYNQQTGAAVGAPFTSTIPAAASKVYSLSTLSPALPSGNVNGLYSAQVTSTNSMALAGVAGIWTGAKSGEFATYDGVIAGSQTSYVPALYKNYYNFTSSLTVQNVGTASTSVTITYSNGQTVTESLSANQAKEFYTPNNAALPSGNTAGVFSAKVVAASGGSIVTLVNVEDKVNGSLASYNGANTATSSIGCPVVMKAYYKWFSAQTVQNVGTAATNITITYADGKTRTFNNVQPNGTINIIELANAGSVLSDTSSLSASITSSGGVPIVAVVQENSNERYALNHGDYLLAYTCSPQ